nr:CHAT domain-containing protein [Kibdelosporangium phytohabitans]
MDRELRGIKETLRAGKDRDRFELDDHSAVRLKDMMQALLDFSPSVVHLSGHGTEDGRFLAETDAGAAKIVAVDGMAALFREFADTIRCVIVNACHSETLAQALVEHVDHVIGMRSRIGDRSAITFSVGFYQALAAGRPIDKAFSVGCAAIALHDKEGKGGDIPKLFRR